MKDDRGIYYHPNPADTKARMYVRRGGNDEIEFRLWQLDHEEVWEKHEWLPASVIREAAAMYKKLGRGEQGSDPMKLYDTAVANALLKEDA